MSLKCCSATLQLFSIVFPYSGVCVLLCPGICPFFSVCLIVLLFACFCLCLIRFVGLTIHMAFRSYKFAVRLQLLCLRCNWAPPSPCALSEHKPWKTGVSILLLFIYFWPYLFTSSTPSAVLYHICSFYSKKSLSIQEKRSKRSFASQIMVLHHLDRGV